MLSFRNATIKKKLTWMSALASFSALLLAGSAFFAYHLVTFRSSIVRNLVIQADTIGLHSVSALRFNDERSAGDTLAALRADRNIITAAIYSADGNLFASYVGNSDDSASIAAAIPPGQSEAIRFEGRTLRLYHPIVAEGERLGSVHLAYSLDDLYADMARYVAIAAVVLALSVLVALLASSRIQRSFSEPIARLAKTAGAVSREKNYSIRVEPTRNRDEMGVLIDTFNEMLAQIQVRDAAVEAGREQFQKLNEELEQRVLQRTAELEARNTEQKRLEEQLRHKNEELEEQNRRVQEANRLKSEFLANMSHELRTPLNGIIGFAELMHDDKVGPVSPEHKEYLGDILTSGRHLLQLINDVLDLAKVESGKMEFRPEPLDLSKAAGEVRDILRTLTARKRIQIETAIDPTLTGIVADPAKLKQVLYNYLSNALKFTPDEGRVTVRFSPDGADAFRLEVADTGIGIRPEDLSRLFVEFKQLDASTAKKYPGTGLGLALTRRIVEAQGGRVGVDSTPGQGSVFFAVLPLVSQIEETPTGDPQSAPMPSAPPGAPSILVIEDDPTDSAWLRDTLARAGYDVHTAATGTEALQRCRERSFDAITLDLLLPDTNGWDVLRAIRGLELHEHTPVIVVSVVADKDAGLAFTIQDFLVKPVNAGALLAAVRRAASPGTETSPILVVDDDPNALKLAAQALTAAGYRAVTERDAERGLRIAAKEHPALVILDLLMPGMDGFEFLQRFRRTKEGHHTPVIVWTVKDLTAEMRARLKASAQAVVLKGEGSNAELLAEIQAHMASCQR